MEEQNNPIQPNMGNTMNNATKQLSVPALLSFIFSLVGLIILGLPLGIAAVITGIVGLVKFNNDTQKFKWMAIVGIIVGALDVVAVVFNMIVTFLVLA